MRKTYRPYEPNQALLLPPSLQDWLPSKHLAFFVMDVVRNLDLSGIYAFYEQEERGYPPYHPEMMLQVLVYAYCRGIYSSRKIARAIEEEVPFRVLAAGNLPDFRTVSDFRKRHLKEFHNLFVQALRLCQEAGLVKMGRVALDGSKIKANASKHKAMSYGRMKKKLSELEAEVKELLQRAEEEDAREDAEYGVGRRGDELPEELAIREKRLKKIKEAKEALEKEVQEEAKKRGQPAELAVPADKAQRNFTDPESRIMKGSDGFVQAYNAQILVDEEAQVIVAERATNEGTDHGAVLKLVEQVEENTGRLPEKLLSDAGTASKSNLGYLEGRKIDAYVATEKLRHGSPAPQAPRGRIPKDMGLLERMKRKLQTRRGREEYKHRKAIVEPVFGQVKHARSFAQFSLRGGWKVQGEWSLICAVHNLLKLFGGWQEAGTGVLGLT